MIRGLAGLLLIWLLLGGWLLWRDARRFDACQAVYHARAWCLQVATE